MSDRYREVNETGNEFVALTDDCGDVVKFFHVGTIEYNGEWFAFFQSAVKLDCDPDELLIFKILGEGKDEELVPLKEEPLLTEVYNAFLKEIADEEDTSQPLPNTGCCGGGCCESKGNCNVCVGCMKK